MPTPTELQTDTWLTLLGYGVEDDIIAPDIVHELTQPALDRADALATSITSIQTQLENMLVDSEAVKIDKLEVDFKQKYRLLCRVGTQRIKELSSIIGVPIQNNPFGIGIKSYSYSIQ